MIRWLRSYRNSCKKARAPCRPQVLQKRPRQRRSPICARIPSQASAAEEQPQQNNHRYRHAQQPQQNSTSHDLLQCILHVIKERKRRGWVPAKATETRMIRQAASASELRKASYQCPVFGIEAQGSAGGFASPFCKISIECRSGERTKAIWPSRGGRLMVMPIFFSRSQVA
jgi:hypothetical protein